MGDHTLILIGLGLSIIAAYTAFLFKWISLDATKAVIILGTMVLGLGGWILAASVVFFFGFSSILTRINEYEQPHFDNKPSRKRRDGYQVWANGFWVAIFCVIWFSLDSISAFIAAFAVVATATADTWATEIGTLKPGKTWNITTLEPVTPGVDGGISIKGTAAAFIGSAIIALFIFGTGIYSPLRFFWIILLTGFVGTLIDSVVGALFHEKNVELSAPDDFSSSSESFTNSFVNWAATGISGLLACLITEIVLL
ncbi:MAG: DUF92 domain-containing protein [Balneolaceae bacterium]|nr:DUF92 domain-containing protein [Balneolaceae bacterium]